MRDASQGGGQAVLDRRGAQHVDGEGRLAQAWAGALEQLAEWREKAGDREGAEPPFVENRSRAGVGGSPQQGLAALLVPGLLPQRRPT